MSENQIEAISLDEAVARMSGTVEEAKPTEVEEAEEVLADSSDVAETDEVETGDEDETGEIETTDDEPTADDLEDEPEAEAPEVGEDPIVTIKTVNGTEQVAQSEVEAGYMRQQDYTKKTMEVAEDRKAVEAHAAHASQMEQQLKQALEYWAVPTEQEPNWAAASKQGYSPQQIFQGQQEWAERQKKQNEARETHQALQAREQQKQSDATLKTQESELHLLQSKRPELVDPVKLKAFGASLAKDAHTHFGITPEQMGAVQDHQSILILADAVKYRELKAGKAGVAKKVAKAPKKLAPGAKPQKSDSVKAVRQKAEQRLKQSGSMADGLALMQARRQS
jgi:hypothetical protein